jgi:predicted kinase
MYDSKLKQIREAYVQAQSLEESIEDKNIFKSVILSGGPGSGKSFIAQKAIGSFDMRVINTDHFFEYGLHKANLPLKIDPEDVETYTKQMAVRDVGKISAKTRLGHWINGMLPIIIDGTGKDAGKVQKQKDALENLGYDVYLLVVLTHPEVALQRNKRRKRSVPEELVVQGNKAVRNNLSKFEDIFSSENMYVVDNSRSLNDKEIEDLSSRLSKLGNTWIKSPVQNPKGQAIIKALKETGGKYLDDISPNWMASVPKL